MNNKALMYLCFSGVFLLLAVTSFDNKIIDKVKEVIPTIPPTIPPTPAPAV